MFENASISSIHSMVEDVYFILLSLSLDTLHINNQPRTTDSGVEFQVGGWTGRTTLTVDKLTFCFITYGRLLSGSIAAGV